MLVIFLGAPGSGKGTISDIMVREYEYEHISTGDIFRKIISQETALGLKVKGIIESGKLVDDETTWEVAKVALEEFDLSKQKVILDGYPRNINQSKLLDSWLEEKNLQQAKTLYFEVPEKILLERLSSRIMCKSCGRAFNKITMPTKTLGVCDFCDGEIYQRKDDRPENVQVRLNTYKEVTEPLINYYDEKGILIKIKADTLSKDVAEKSLKLLEEK